VTDGRPSAANAEPERLPQPAWGRAAGLVELPEARPVDLSEAADRQLIVERASRYCWSYDERDLERLEACFTEDGVWEGSVMGRIAIGPFEGSAAVGRWMAGFWPYQHDQRRHMIVNPVVLEQGPEEALLVAYILLMSAKDAQVRLETMGFYRMRMRKEDGLWRIGHLFAGFDAPFWPGALEELSEKGRARHGITRVRSEPAP
jgi:hypothetical protein